TLRRHPAPTRFPYATLFRSVLQQAGALSAQEAGLLTLGYAIMIVVFIRVGEKLLQHFGPRKPMLWGSCIVAVAVALLMPTNLMRSEEHTSELQSRENLVCRL